MPKEEKKIHHRGSARADASGDGSGNEKWKRRKNKRLDIPEKQMIFLLVLMLEVGTRWIPGRVNFISLTSTAGGVMAEGAMMCRDLALVL